MIRLRTLDEEEFEPFKAYFIEKYAREMAREYDIDMETARKEATRQIEGRLAQGAAALGSFIYAIELQSTSGSTHIGYLEYLIEPDKDLAWLDSIDIFEPYQHQGHGKQALTLMEQELAEKGITSISLHVSAYNDNALRFYQSRGFKFTGHLATYHLEKG